MHRTLLGAFPALPERTSFRKHTGLLYRVDDDVRGGRTVVLVQSQEQPDWAFLCDQDYLVDQNSKPIAAQYERLATGQVLSFRLRANVTKKIDTKTGSDGKRRHGRRVSLRRPEEQIDWVKRKGMEAGFALSRTRDWDSLDCRASPEQDVKARRERGAATMTFGSVLFEGRLEVTSREMFIAALVNGIGSAKAFGFGLLSVAPVRS